MIFSRLCLKHAKVILYYTYTHKAIQVFMHIKSGKNIPENHKTLETEFI